ncbi:UNVERIFIED_CONTAM: thioesterase [Mumia flava]
MEPGLAATEEHVVGDADTAVALGSGSLPVLATPRVLAWCERATCAAIDSRLPDGSTSVGTRVRLDHLAASAVDARVAVTATVRSVDGRLVTFEVVAVDAGGTLLAQGEVRRVVVDVDRFLARVPA